MGLEHSEGSVATGDGKGEMRVQSGDCGSQSMLFRIGNLIVGGDSFVIFDCLANVFFFFPADPC
jgi:hypothetical protein